MSFKKKIFKFSISQKILAFIGYLYILFVCYTSKIQIINSELPEKLWRENKPFILAFWHGQLMMIGHVWKSKAVLNMLASSHSDGRFGAYIAGHFNLKNVSIPKGIEIENIDLENHDGITNNKSKNIDLLKPENPSCCTIV